MADFPSAVPGTEAFFLPLAGGGRFCLFHPAVGADARRGAIVYVHPFAEEMNKSRRMAALQSHALSAAGFAVLQIDLHGCGDSAGDFGDASWQAWVDDVVAAAGWLRTRTGIDPALWGLRAGCLIAREAAQRIHPVPSLLMWQPAVSGTQHLQQFLRLKVAQQFGADAQQRIGTKELRAELDAGRTVEVAGYALAPALAQGLAGAELAPLTSTTRVAWIEVAGSAPADLSPGGRLRMQAWAAAGHEMAEHAVVGLPFWQTQEIAECVALIDTTCAAVRQWHP
ncbi:MAG: hydrolase 2, exosortase A system-associated [Betaproteobacteria bacterium]